MQTSIDPASIATLDQDDPLRSKRDAFVLPRDVIYLDGNSLGPMPKAALRELKVAAEREWAEASSAAGMAPAGLTCPRPLATALRT